MRACAAYPGMLCRVTLVGLLAMLFGCHEQPAEQKAGPSYADLVAIYTNEMATLDRLEKKRDDLVQKYKAELRPDPQDALKALGGILDSASGAGIAADGDEVLDPNAMLDRAVEDAQNVQDVTSKVLDSLTTEPEEDEQEKQRKAEIQEKYERELASLDKEIEAQKQRVQRAREARDAAEAEMGK